MKGTADASSQRRTYLARYPPKVRKVLKGLRASIRAAAPGAEEAFSYGIPGFRFDGQPLVWFAGWKQHVSLYPIGAAIVSALSPALDHCETSKGTVRFPIDAPPSAALVKRIVKARIAQIRTKARI